MSKIKIGQVLTFDFPFDTAASYEGEELVPGCEKHEEQIDQGYADVWFTCKAIGKINFEILSIAKMPGKYIDRVIVKKSYTLPGGEPYNKGRSDIKMFTIGNINKYIDTGRVFPVDYDEL